MGAGIGGFPCKFRDSDTHRDGSVHECLYSQQCFKSMTSVIGHNRRKNRAEQKDKKVVQWKGCEELAGLSHTPMLCPSFHCKLLGWECISQLLKKRHLHSQGSQYPQKHASYQEEAYQYRNMRKKCCFSKGEPCETGTHNLSSAAHVNNKRNDNSQVAAQ